MRALELDYLRPAKQRRLVALVLGFFALGFAVDAGLYYARLAEGIEREEHRLARTSQQSRQPAGAPPIGTDELTAARDTLRRLTTPWESLFQALETAKTERVFLLTVEPSVESRTLTITAEAKDYLAALTYVARLGDAPALQRVHLVRHEVRRGSPQRRVTFTVSASWGEG